jgi:integrase/recombinase XerD
MVRTFRSRVPGPLAPYADGFRSELARQGYARDSTELYVGIMGRLSRWMIAQELDVSGLTPDQLERFLAVQSASKKGQLAAGRLPPPLRTYLVTQGVLPSPVTKVSSPADELLERYRQYLVEKRGLAPRTIPDYVSLARRFLAEILRRTGDITDLRSLDGAQITAFVLPEVSRLTIGSACNTVNWLRSFLRFLHVEGNLETDLAITVPPVAGWRGTRLPVALTRAQVTALLDSCDRSQAVGLRDFAMLMLLARLGLRAVEVARLELGDIDWRQGELLIRSKGGRLDRLPLPPDVGEALVGYLRNGRPPTESRLVFITHCAPHRGVGRNAASHAVQRACARVGIPAARAHRLRHALATEMLRRGATLPEIGQVLRHRDLATTAVYAKVDRVALGSVVQPWPGEAR